VTIEWGVLPFSVADWNGDGVADVISVLNSTQAISGASGQTLLDGGTFLAYGVPILRDVNNDGILDATLQGGHYPSRTLQHDLTTASWVGADTQPYPTGAIADCADAPLLLEGTDLYPSRVYTTPVTGASAGMQTFSVLAGGKQFPDEPTATAAGAYLGQLSDLAIATNLTGSGKPAAVVGSSDGWLYALDACSGTLLYSLELGESVCGAIFGDTNADGREEILVSTSGGYLYDIQNQALGSCGPVLDVDPPHGIVDKEVSQIVTQSTLFGAWEAVENAQSYQVAVTHDPEGIISDPPWQDVGNTTSGAVSGLPLVVGQTYLFAVRAVGPQGNSVDALSAGATVVAAGRSSDAGMPIGGSGGAAPGGSVGPAPTAATPSASAGCGCGTIGTASLGSPFEIGLCLGAALLAKGRRGRRRNK
jgi:hypothetical protein